MSTSRTVAFVLFGEDSSSDHHYRVTSGPAHVAVVNVPCDIEDREVGQQLNATTLFRRDDARVDIEFARLGPGRVIVG